MDFCPALDMANMCIQLQATLDESEKWSSKDYWIVGAAAVQAIGSIVVFATAEWRASTAVTREATKRAENAKQIWCVVEPALTRLAGLGIQAEKCACESAFASLFIRANFNRVEIDALLHELANTQALSFGDTELSNIIGSGKSLAAGLVDVFGEPRKQPYWSDPGTLFKLARIGSYASIIQDAINAKETHAFTSKS